MINLLPELQKKEWQREYKLRVVVVSLVLFCALVAIAIVLLLPSFGLALYKSKVADTVFSTVTDTSVELKERKEVEETFKNLDRSMKVLAGSEQKVQPTDLFSLIVARKAQGIRLTALNFTEGEKQITLGIAGVAATRQNLQSFITELQKETSLGTVDVPVSNFAKDTNIAFSFEIVKKP